MTIPSESDPRIQPLLEWNRLARQNAENAMVSSMFEAGFQASEPIEAFSTWLLVGAAAVASFLIANADKLVPFIGSLGFFVCGCLLCLSCVSWHAFESFGVEVQDSNSNWRGSAKDFCGASHKAH